MIRLLREEKGAAIVVIALSMTVMMGFATLIVGFATFFLECASKDNYVTGQFM